MTLAGPKALHPYEYQVRGYEELVRIAIECPPELVFDAPTSDVYMWAISMYLAAIHAFGDVPAVDTRDRHVVIERGIALLEPLSPDVALLLRECLEYHRHKRPCSSEARDRVLAAAGVWPPLGG